MRKFTVVPHVEHNDKNSKERLAIVSSRHYGIRHSPIGFGRKAPNESNSGRLSIWESLPYRGSPCGWYEITITNGKQYSRQGLICAIHQFIQRPIPFVPYNIKIHGDDLTFFVDDEELAKAVNKANMQCNERPDGLKIQTNALPHLPNIEIDDSAGETIIEVIFSSFDPTTQHMNLSGFYANKELRRREIFAPLNSRNVLHAVCQIIAERTPNLRSLDLSRNKIYNADDLMRLRSCAPNLKSLHLGRNLLQRLRPISCLYGYELVTLVLEDNLIPEWRAGHDSYVSELCRIFKSLRVLDGINLPPRRDILKELRGQSTSFPLSHDSFVCDPNVAMCTKVFLHGFLYAHDCREGLLAMYADDAQFSMTAYSLDLNVDLRRYSRESRNFKSGMVDSEKRSTLLCRGKEEIVRLLNRLPKTQHDPTTLTLDLLVHGSEQTSFCVNGIFYEIDNPESITSNFKAFNRTLVMVPTGSGTRVMNDMLTVTNATQTQILKAFRTTIASSPPSVPTLIEPQAARTVVPTTSEIVVSELSQQLGMLTTSEVKTGIGNVIDSESSSRKQEEMTTLTMRTGIIVPTSTDGQGVDSELRRKQGMVTSVATLTRMNWVWAEKCLVDTNWDFDNAMSTFAELHMMGKIPNEAFDTCEPKIFRRRYAGHSERCRFFSRRPLPIVF